MFPFFKAVHEICMFSDMSEILFFKGPMISCCTEYQNDPLAFKYLQNYTKQEGTDYCNIKATMWGNNENKRVPMKCQCCCSVMSERFVSSDYSFCTKKGLTFCADPEKTWVIKAMKYLDRWGPFSFRAICALQHCGSQWNMSTSTFLLRLWSTDATENPEWRLRRWTSAGEVDFNTFRRCKKKKKNLSF